MANGLRSESEPVEPDECTAAEPEMGDTATEHDKTPDDERRLRGRAHPGDRDDPERELRLGDVDWAERGVLFEWLLDRLLDRLLDTERGDRVRDRSRDPDVERDRDLERDGTDADDGERDRLRLRLLLGGVRESDRDLDRLGDRLPHANRQIKKKICKLTSGTGGPSP